MNDIKPINQTRLFGLDIIINELIQLKSKDTLPNKILLSGPKGLGKSTLAYHFINYVLSKGEEFSYDVDKLMINPENRIFKTTLNKSNPNLIVIDVNFEKQTIEINQIRDLIINLNKTSFNDKPRFVLIDNIERLNLNSINSLLKVLEEPNFNINFILINNSKKVLPTLLSRCIDFKVNLTNNESITVINSLLNGKITDFVNSDLINYYSTPGNIYNLVKFAEINKYDLVNLNLKELLNLIITKNHYKKDNLIKYLIYEMIEFYFRKINLNMSQNLYYKYSYFIKRISDTKKFNLDEEILFVEFQEEILNG